MRRALAPLLALVLVACARDLELPSSSPPRVDTVEVVGIEGARTAPVPLRVLAGEMIAIRGGGFPADEAQLEVRIGSEDAEVLDLAPDRIVVKVPTLFTFGAVDLQVRSPVGFRTVAGALQYDGWGQPLGFETSDLPTSVPLGFVAPIQPPNSAGFSDLAIAAGASDSALLVVPAAGVAVTTIPLGLVPVSAAARLVELPPGGPTADLEVQVLALGRGGEVALGRATLDRTAGTVKARDQAWPLVSVITPQPCENHQVMFTYGGTPVAAWFVLGQQRIATIDMAAVTGPGAPYRAIGTPHTVAAPIKGWAPWQLDSVVFAAGQEIYVYDAAAGTEPTPLTYVPGGGIGLPVSVSSQLASGGCGAGPITFHTLAAAATPTSEALAVSYKTGTGADRVALVNVTTGSMTRGIAGMVASSLALVPDPPYSAPTSWAVVGAGSTSLQRFRPLAGAPACGDLVPDAALEISTAPSGLPPFGGMATTASGTRLLSLTPDGDMITVLPPSLTSAGSVLRVASYGGLSMQVATLGGFEIPVAVAEHATAEGGLDTGSALLLLPFITEGVPVSLGGSGYGRGAVWLDPAGDGSALAYTGDQPALNAGSIAARGGAAAVTDFTVTNLCEGEDVRITRSRPAAGGVDLLAQGPVRSGVLGTDGVGRYGPAAPPVYAVRDTTIAVYLPDPARVACISGSGGAIDWDACVPDATVALGVRPLDVTLSAGDRAVAARTLEPVDSAECAAAAGFTPPCASDDLLCHRATCPPARQLVVAPATPPGAAAVTVSLPAWPAGIAADRGGGFLVTLRCESTAMGEECFGASALCDELAAPASEVGALVLVPEDGGAPVCLGVGEGYGGPLAVAPNGAEAWVAAVEGAVEGTDEEREGTLTLTRIALARSPQDGGLDPAGVRMLSREALGRAGKIPKAFPPSGIGFSPDGSTAIVTVPGEHRILLKQ